MPGIFISYRRQDSQSAAGRLAACTAVDVLANGNQIRGWSSMRPRGGATC